MGSSRCTAKSISLRANKRSTKVNFATHAMWYEHAVGEWVKVGHVKEAKALAQAAQDGVVSLYVLPRGATPRSSVTQPAASRLGFFASYPDVDAPTAVAPTLSDVIAQTLCDPERFAVWTELNAEPQYDPDPVEVLPSDVREHLALSKLESEARQALSGPLSDKALNTLAMNHPEVLLEESFNDLSDGLFARVLSAHAGAHFLAPQLKKRALDATQLAYFASRYSQNDQRAAVASRDDLTLDLVRALLTDTSPEVTDALIANENLPEGSQELLTKAVSGLIDELTVAEPISAASHPLLSTEQVDDLLVRAVDLNATDQKLAIEKLLNNTELSATQRAVAAELAPAVFARHGVPTPDEADIILAANSPRADRILSGVPGLTPTQIGRLIRRASHRDTGQDSFVGLVKRDDLTPRHRAALIKCRNREVFALRVDLTEAEKATLIDDPTEKVGSAMATRRDLTPDQCNQLLLHPKQAVRNMVATNPNMPPESVREILIENPRTKVADTYRNAKIMQELGLEPQGRYRSDLSSPYHSDHQKYHLFRNLREYLFCAPENLSVEQIRRGQNNRMSDFSGTVAEYAAALKAGTLTLEDS